MARFAILEEWSADWREGVKLAGEEFPFAVAEEGPLIQPVEFPTADGNPGLYILWLPLVVIGDPKDGATRITGRPEEDGCND